jgi:hypothetical protein
MNLPVLIVAGMHKGDLVDYNYLIINDIYKVPEMIF